MCGAQIKKKRLRAWVHSHGTPYVALTISLEGVAHPQRTYRTPFGLTVVPNSDTQTSSKLFELSVGTRAKGTHTDRGEEQRQTHLFSKEKTARSGVASKLRIRSSHCSPPPQNVVYHWTDPSYWQPNKYKSFFWNKVTAGNVHRQT